MCSTDVSGMYEMSEKDLDQKGSVLVMEIRDQFSPNPDPGAQLVSEATTKMLY